MCGFLGEFYFNKSDFSSLKNFAELLALSKHRGPDATTISTGASYRMGLNQFASQDVTTTGKPPANGAVHRYHIVCDGTVYNFQELILKYGLQNIPPMSNSNIILQLLELIGVEDTVEILNGMFALAIMDIHENELYITRDFAGIKPFYFGTCGQGILFASQFDQIFKHPWFSSILKLRPEIVYEYFAFGYMAAPNTIYENIYQIRPGELLRINSTGGIIKKSIVQFPKASNLSNYLDSNELESILQKSIELQLNFGGPSATFLSGGIDSALVTSIAKEQKTDIQAYTLKDDENNLNETVYAEAYAHYLKVNHQLVKIDEKSLLAIIEEHFASFPEPFGDYSSIPTYVITKHASQYHTTILSGDGGDELFWGYTRMYETIKKSWWFYMPLNLRINVMRLTNKLGLTSTYAPNRKNLATYWREWHQKIPEGVLGKAFMVGPSEEINDLYSIKSNYSKKQLQHFLRWNEYYGHLQRVLIKVDRTSMKNSIQVRIPLLDKNIIKKSWGMFFPLAKIEDLKRPLKELLRKKIPENLIMEGKRGFSVPIESWFRNQLKSDLIETVLTNELYGHESFNQAVIKKYVEDFLEEKHHNGWGVWHIYAWQKWAKRYDISSEAGKF